MKKIIIGLIVVGVCHGSFDHGDHHHSMEEMKCNEKLIYGICGEELNRFVGELNSWNPHEIEHAAKHFSNCVESGAHSQDVLLCSDSISAPVRMVKPMEAWTPNSPNPCRAAIGKTCASELNDMISILKTGGDSISLASNSKKVQECLKKNRNSIDQACESPEMEKYLTGIATDLPVAVEIQKCMLEIKQNCADIIENIKSDFHRHQMMNMIYDAPELVQCIGAKTTPELKCTTKFAHVIMEGFAMKMRQGHQEQHDFKHEHDHPVMKVLHGEIIERRFYLELGNPPHFHGLWWHFIMLPILGAFAFFFIGCCCGRRCCRRKMLGEHPCPDHHHPHHHHHHKCHRIHRFFARFCPHHHGPHPPVEEGIEIENPKVMQGEPIVRGDIEYQNMKTDDAAPIRNI